MPPIIIAELLINNSISPLFGIYRPILYLIFKHFLGAYTQREELIPIAASWSEKGFSRVCYVSDIEILVYKLLLFIANKNKYTRHIIQWIQYVRRQVYDNGVFIIIRMTHSTHELFVIVRALKRL